jgi:hypothetical protein
MVPTSHVRRAGPADLDRVVTKRNSGHGSALIDHVVADDSIWMSRQFTDLT